MQYLFEKPKVLELGTLYKKLSSYERMSLRDKIDFIDHVISHHGMINFNINISVPFFRIRYIGNKPVNKIQDILWPPKTSSSSTYGNRLGDGVFYLASSIHTALAEAKRKTESTFKLGHAEKAVVSVFQLKKGISFRILPVGETSKLINGTTGHITQKSDMQRYISVLNCSFVKNENLTLSYLVQDDFLCDQILSDNVEISEYTINSLINKMMDIDVIGYKSLKSYDGYNFAVLRNNFHNIFELVYASKINVYKLYGKYYKTETTEMLSTITAEDNLIWEPNESGCDNIWKNLSGDECRFLPFGATKG